MVDLINGIGSGLAAILSEPELRRDQHIPYPASEKLATSHPATSSNRNRWCINTMTIPPIHSVFALYLAFENTVGFILL